MLGAAQRGGVFCAAAAAEANEHNTDFKCDLWQAGLLDTPQLLALSVQSRNDMTASCIYAFSSIWRYLRCVLAYVRPGFSSLASCFCNVTTLHSAVIILILTSSVTLVQAGLLDRPQLLALSVEKNLMPKLSRLKSKVGPSFDVDLQYCRNNPLVGY